MGLMTATKPTSEYRRLDKPFGAWPAGAILHVMNPAAWDGVASLGERVDDAAVPNFTFDAADHARYLAIENAPRRAAPVREPIRHDVLMRIFNWTELDYAAALRIGFPKPGESGTGTAHDYVGLTLTAKWTTYAPDVINEWLTTVQTFGARLPKTI